MAKRLGRRFTRQVQARAQQMLDADHWYHVRLTFTRHPDPKFSNVAQRGLAEQRQRALTKAREELVAERVRRRRYERVRRERFHRTDKRLLTQTPETVPYPAVIYDAPMWPNHLRPVRWVTVYHVENTYGGPEEGGWYYDHWEPGSFSIPVRNRAHAERVAAHLSHVCGDYFEQPPLYSVLSTGLTRVVMEHKRFERATKVRPHYE